MTKEAISTERALRLALEALENAWLDASMGKGDVARHTEAITALRVALASRGEALTSVPDSASKAIEQPAQIDWEAVAADQAMTIGWLKAVQPAQPQQEPVAWLIDSNYTTVFRDIAEHHRNKGAKVEPLYTASPTLSLAQRQSRSDVKPLTDDQMWQIWNSQGDDAMEQQSAIAFARAIEAAHGIKENT